MMGIERLSVVRSLPSSDATKMTKSAANGIQTTKARIPLTNVRRGSVLRLDATLPVGQIDHTDDGPKHSLFNKVKAGNGSQAGARDGGSNGVFLRPQDIALIPAFRSSSRLSSSIQDRSLL